MRKSNKESKGGRGKKKFKSGGNFKKGGGYERPEMFKATCKQCHESCEVPFKPVGDKSVFCSDCFAAIDKDEKNEKEGFAKEDDYKKQIKVLNDKLDTIIKMLAEGL